MPVYYNYVFKVWGASHILPPLLLCLFSLIVLVLEFVVWWKCGAASLQSHFCPPGGEESRCGDAWCQQREHTKPVGWCCFWSSRSEMYGTFHCHPCRRSTKLVAWTGWSCKGSPCQCRYLRLLKKKKVCVSQIWSSLGCGALCPSQAQYNKGQKISTFQQVIEYHLGWLHCSKRVHLHLQRLVHSTVCEMEQNVKNCIYTYSNNPK